MANVKDFIFAGSVSDSIYRRKVKINPSTCAFSVAEYDRITNWHQCYRKPVVEIDGYWFCAQHARTVSRELGISETTKIVFAAKFSRGYPDLIELEVIRETKNTIDIKSVKAIQGSSTGIYAGNVRKDSAYIKEYKLFGDKNEAVAYLIDRSAENIRWHTSELERAEKTHKQLLDAWHKKEE